MQLYHRRGQTIVRGRDLVGGSGKQLYRKVNIEMFVRGEICMWVGRTFPSILKRQLPRLMLLIVILLICLDTRNYPTR